MALHALKGFSAPGRAINAWSVGSCWSHHADRACSSPDCRSNFAYRDACPSRSWPSFGSVAFNGNGASIVLVLDLVGIIIAEVICARRRAWLAMCSCWSCGMPDVSCSLAAFNLRANESLEWPVCRLDQPSFAFQSVTVYCM